MNGFLLLLFLALGAVIVFAIPPMVTPYVSIYGVVTVYDTARAVFLCGILTVVAIIVIFRQGIDSRFLLRIFVSGLLIRMVVASGIFVYKAQDFFGGDAFSYDSQGFAQLQALAGANYFQVLADSFVGGSGSGWGMVYMVASIYGMIGRNMLAIQLVNSVLGAATAVLIYLCAHHVFNNQRVARLAGIGVAFYPSLILWSSQGLKDGPIVFLLALSILATLKLGEKLSVKYILALLFSLLCLLSFRFYVFYMVCVAIGGAFAIGMQSISANSFLRQFAVIILLGFALTYMGVTRSASVQYEQYGNLEKLQVTREDQSRTGNSGFGRDVDVSTTSGALSTIPIGLIYLLLAPFPWQLASLRQSITLPEMVVWWTSLPLLVLGSWFAIKYRLRMISPILIFTVMLTFAYSVFQGNVGTAYRQRSQLLVFYFIFVAVGFVLLQEKREERKRLGLLKRRQIAARQAATFAERAARTTE
jgi:hypothetical protein